MTIGTVSADSRKEFLTVTVSGQSFGIPVLLVQDVLSEQKVTKVPLAPKEISGSLNLRGRIVTAINLRHKLSMPETSGDVRKMYVVVDHHGELYSLIVDQVGDVLSLSDKDFENNPTTLDASWRELSLGVYRLKEQLLIILDVAGMLSTLCLKNDSAAGRDQKIAVSATNI